MLSASELIRRIGPAIEGELWKKALARRLGLAERNVYRWTQGTITPRPGVFADLLGMMRKRRAELDELIAAVEVYLKEQQR